MRDLETIPDERIRKKRMNIGAFLSTYVVLLLLVGVQMGIIVMPLFDGLPSFWQVSIIMIYWAFVVFIFLLMTNAQIKTYYEAPIKKLGQAARQVANGDFSIYIEPIHAADEYDYMDVMFLDFNIMVRELGSIETLKNDFTSNVSHEIKTPLAIIKNYTTALKAKDLPQETREAYITAIVNATDRLSGLVTNILRLNKLENQEIETTYEPFDVSRQLTECILNFEHLWDEKKIDLEVVMDDEAVVKGDKELLDIVWNNLFSNAIKYSDIGSKVTISQTSNDKNVIVKVKDTGLGMDELTVRRVFDKFYQADQSRATEGNGLGLTLAYRIIENFEGSISVTSAINVGTTFTVTIPKDRYQISNEEMKTKQQRDRRH